MIVPVLPASAGDRSRSPLSSPELFSDNRQNPIPLLQPNQKATYSEMPSKPQPHLSPAQSLPCPPLTAPEFSVLMSPSSVGRFYCSICLCIPQSVPTTLLCWGWVLSTIGGFLPGGDTIPASHRSDLSIPLLICCPGLPCCCAP